MEHIENGAAEQQRLIITEQEAGQRADVGLAAMLELTRSNMQKLLEEGRAVRGSKVLKSNYKLRLGDEIDVTLPEPQPLDVQPENIPLDIIYEDEDVVVVNNDRKKMAVVKEGGRDAVTEYEVLERFGKYTIVRCRLRTGRTHQIRVHMEYLGYPLVGDPKYSPMKTPFSIQGQALHSQTLEFTHPRTGERLSFEAPLPEDMHKIVTRLRLGQFN